MSEIAEDLTNKVGPLPAWAWGGIALAAYFAYEHFVQGSVSSAATDTSDSGTADDTTGDTTDDGTDDGTGLVDDGLDNTDDSGGDFGDIGSGNDGNAGGVIYGTTTTGTVVTNYSTNQQWLIAAIDALRSQGDSASLATTALTLYLRGSKLTANEGQYVNAAIESIGPPPNPLPIKTGGTAAGALAAPKVTLSSKTKTSFRVTWTAVSGATGYQVNHDGKVVKSLTRSYTVRGLKSKSSHTISVRAAKGSALGAPSNRLQVVTK